MPIFETNRCRKMSKKVSEPQKSFIQKVSRGAKNSIRLKGETFFCLRMTIERSNLICILNSIRASQPTEQPFLIYRLKKVGSICRYPRWTCTHRKEVFFLPALKQTFRFLQINICSKNGAVAIYILVRKFVN